MRYIPDNNLAYPVLINVGTGSASGFFLNNDRFLYFVSARHVFYNKKDDGYVLKSDKAKLTAYGHDISINKPNILELDLNLLESSGNLKKHPQADVVVIRIGQLFPNSEKGFILTLTQDIIWLEKVGNPIVGIKKEYIKPYSDVLISNEVIVLGYPNSLGHIESGQLDYTRPLLRKGIVAGKNDNTKTIILDCPIYQGNSGGLVLEIEQISSNEKRASAIGVVIEFIPFIEELKSKQYGTVNVNIENSGYSILAPMDFVLELISNMESQINATH